MNKQILQKVPLVFTINLIKILFYFFFDLLFIISQYTNLLERNECQMKDTTKQLKEMDDLIDIYKQTVKDVKDTFINDLKNDNLNIKLAEKLEYISDEDIKNMSLVDINALLDECECSQDTFKTAYYHLPDKSITFNEFCVDVLAKCKEKWIGIKEAESNLKELEDERLDISRSYANALKSPEYRQARLDHLEFLKKQAETELDDTKRKEILSKLEHIEKSQNFTFLNERLHSVGKKEAMSIMDSYFDQTKGRYIMDRYYSRLERLDINRALHGQFFNLEENYLPSTYEVFNNFFLYHVIRFIAYVNIDVKHEYLYMTSIVGALRDLVTGEATEEEKSTIINVMKDFYTFFEYPEIIEKFKERNSSYKNHPDRIEAEKRAAERRRIQTLATIKAELGSLFDETAEYDDPEEFLKQIINEKLNMLNFISENGNPGGLHSYEEIFNEFTRLQNFISRQDKTSADYDEMEDSNLDSEDKELDDHELEEEEDCDGSEETTECCDESGNNTDSDETGDE